MLNLYRCVVITDTRNLLKFLRKFSHPVNRENVVLPSFCPNWMFITQCCQILRMHSLFVDMKTSQSSRGLLMLEKQKENNNYTYRSHNLCQCLYVFIRSCTFKYFITYVPVHKCTLIREHKTLSSRQVSDILMSINFFASYFCS